ncbi:MAG TPA: helical backbone metal receptor, partial [Desulfuromonadales bacterium]|nr:helical backbone metal receptor [Desulfuromonadales bacterium]
MRLFLCAFLGAACLAAPASAARWTDAMGRTVEVPENPARIISLVPSVTEILFALGVGDRVVGVTDACTWPEQARTLPKVGSYSGPSLEAVLAQQPDVVFAAADMSAPAWVERLEDLGIPVYVV